MKPSPRIAWVGRECVACGCCEKACPRGAIGVALGVIARVDAEKCVGCGRCAQECPAGVIEMKERRAAV